MHIRMKSYSFCLSKISSLVKSLAAKDERATINPTFGKNGKNPTCGKNRELYDIRRKSYSFALI